MLLYPPHSKEEEGKENANEGADADFFGLVADAFFEAGKV